MIGSHSPGLVALNREIGSDGPATGVMQAGLLALLWVSAYPLTNVLPRFLLGGVLMSIGVVMLIEWIWVVPLVRMTTQSHMLVVAMTIFSCVYGMVPTIFGGILVAALLLVGRFSRLSVLKYHVSMSSHSSILRRSAPEAAYLRQQGERVHILGLEGYLFEGTTVKLVKYLQQAVVALEPQEPPTRGNADRVKLKRSARVAPAPDRDETEPAGAAGNDDPSAAGYEPEWAWLVPHRPDFLVLDFTHVQGLNETAAALLQKFARVCTSHSIRMVFAAIGPNDVTLLHAHGQGAAFRIFQNTRDAVEFCEERLLERSGLFPRPPAVPCFQSSAVPSGVASTVASGAASALPSKLPSPALLGRDARPFALGTTGMLPGTARATPPRPRDLSRSLGSTVEEEPAAQGGASGRAGGEPVCDPSGMPPRPASLNVCYGQAHVSADPSAAFISGALSPAWSEVSVGWLEAAVSPRPFRLPGSVGGGGLPDSSMLQLDAHSRAIPGRPARLPSSVLSLEDAADAEPPRRHRAAAPLNPNPNPNPLEPAALPPPTAPATAAQSPVIAPPPAAPPSSSPAPAGPPPTAPHGDADNPNAWLVNTELRSSVVTCEQILAGDIPIEDAPVEPPHALWRSRSSSSLGCDSSSAGPSPRERSRSAGPGAALFPDQATSPDSATLDLDLQGGAAPHAGARGVPSAEHCADATGGTTDAPAAAYAGASSPVAEAAAESGGGDVCGGEERAARECEEGALAHLDEEHGAIEEARQEGRLPKSFVPQREASGKALFVAARRRRAAGGGSGLHELLEGNSEAEPPRRLVRHMSVPLDLASAGNVRPARPAHAHTHKDLCGAAAAQLAMRAPADDAPNPKEDRGASALFRAGGALGGGRPSPLLAGANCQQLDLPPAPPIALPPSVTEAERAEDRPATARDAAACPVAADSAPHAPGEAEEASALRALDALGPPEPVVLIPLLHSRRHAEADAALLVQLGEWRAYRPEATLCEQGELCDAMFFVAPGHGSVMVEVEVGHVGGPVQALHTGLHGALVGATSLLTRAPCGYSVVAIEQTWVLAIDHAAVKTLFVLHPHTLIRLQRIALLQEPLNTRRLRIMSRLWLAGGWSGANFDQVTVRAAQGDRIRRAFSDGGQEQGGDAAGGGERPGLIGFGAAEEADGLPPPARLAHLSERVVRIGVPSPEGAHAAQGSGAGSRPPVREESLLRSREGARSVSALLDSAAAKKTLTGCLSDSALALYTPTDDEDVHEVATHFEPTLLRLREFSAEIIGRQRSISDMAARWGAMFEELNAPPAITVRTPSGDLDASGGAPHASHSPAPSSSSGYWQPRLHNHGRDRLERSRRGRGDKARPRYQL